MWDRYIHLGQWRCRVTFFSPWKTTPVLMWQSGILYSVTFAMRNTTIHVYCHVTIVTVPSVWGAGQQIVNSAVHYVGESQQINLRLSAHGEVLNGGWRLDMICGLETLRMRVLGGGGGYEGNKQRVDM